ncbi:hypothetical protein CBR_g50708 [Chara braunii]|uniref:Uncharacterized protein n=1 Tax=Chara braunii TaxID=69332 RepID=A0A388K5Q6_CHABU|nr:hypothetical protein CBR_g50708 [Chara braunii]|eukprot:GBG65346.1 hypothetical protein CBR_g50708 [Chara braunii]
MEIDGQGAEALVNGDDGSDTASWDQSKAVGAIRYALQTLYSDDPVIAQQACAAAQRVFANGGSSRSLSSVRHWASRILKQLARARGELNPRLVEEAVGPLVGILSTTSVDRTCDRADSAFILGSMACGGSRCSETIARTGIIGELVRLIDRDDTALPAEREMAAFAIAKLSRKPAENARVVDGAGGLRSLVNLLDVGTSVAKEYAAEAIWCLARDRECAQALVRLGCVRRLASLIRNASVPARVKAHASHALGVFGIHKRIRRVIVEGGAIEALADILRSNLDLTTRINAANTLGILAVQLDDTSRIANAGVVPAVISLLFEADQRAREIGEDSLCVIASSFSNAISIAKHLIAIATDASRSWDDRSTAVDSIWDLATYSHCVSAVGAAGIIPQLISLLDEDEAAPRTTSVPDVAPLEPPCVPGSPSPSSPRACPPSCPTSQPSSSNCMPRSSSSPTLSTTSSLLLQRADPLGSRPCHTLCVDRVLFCHGSTSECGASSVAHMLPPHCHVGTSSSSPSSEVDALPKESRSLSGLAMGSGNDFEAGQGSAIALLLRTDQTAAPVNRKRPLSSDKGICTADGEPQKQGADSDSPTEDGGPPCNRQNLSGSSPSADECRATLVRPEASRKSPKLEEHPDAVCRIDPSCSGPCAEEHAAEEDALAQRTQSFHPSVHSCQREEMAGCSRMAENRSDGEGSGSSDSEEEDGDMDSSSTSTMPNSMREGIAGAFAALSTDEDNRMMMVEAGVITALGKLLTDPLEDVRDSAAEALYHLSREHCYRPQMIRAGLFQILSDVRPDDDQQLGVRVYHFSRVIRRRLLWAMEYEDMKEHQAQEQPEREEDDEGRGGGEGEEDGGDDDSDDGMEFATFVDMECDVEEYLSLMTGADAMMD